MSKKAAEHHKKASGTTPMPHGITQKLPSIMMRETMKRQHITPTQRGVTRFTLRITRSTRRKFILKSTG
jgi:hypothetical protein